MKFQPFLGGPSFATNGASFDTNGFQLIKRKTLLSNEDFYKTKPGSPIITETYYKEIVKAIQEHMPNVLLVSCFGHTVRSTTNNCFGYYPHVHTDYNVVSAFECSDTTWTAQKIATDAATKYFGMSEEMPKKYQLLTAWRNIGDNCIEDNHLAVCDTRSVQIPGDLLMGADSFHLSPKGHSRHKWYHFPNMVKDELLLFKQWDSELPHVGRCFHSSFSDPKAPVGAKARESIEVRVLALFPL